MGVRVVRDSRRKEEPGAYLLVDEDDWLSDLDTVTAWRGPDKPDEWLPKRELAQVRCASVGVDSGGRWTCPVLPEELDDAVRDISEGFLRDAAEQFAAETESSAPFEDQNFEQYGDLLVVASFGSNVYVNGQQIGPGSTIGDPPEGWEELPEGGRIMGEEQYVPLDFLAADIDSPVDERLGRPVSREDLMASIARVHGEADEIPVSVSGDVTIYAPPEGQRADLRRRRRREESLRFRSRRPHEWSPRSSRQA